MLNFKQREHPSVVYEVLALDRDLRVHDVVKVDTSCLLAGVVLLEVIVVKVNFSEVHFQGVAVRVATSQFDGTVEAGLVYHFSVIELPVFGIKHLLLDVL